MSGKHKVKRFLRHPTCKEVFSNENKSAADNNDGYLTVKIVQCGNGQCMRSLNLSQTNRYNLCDTFQVKYPTQRATQKKSKNCCKRCEGYEKRSANCPC